ncbi:lycopene cyclase family protein [Candidatus Pelagibacter sp.]|nr:lycopene cyclase family protein [Candidatus Pelagibacter sp.]
MREFDYIIIGGGCAGLSLAYELEIHEKFKNKTLAIIEPRNDYIRDKTWSFWKVAAHNFEDCVKHSWSNFSVNIPNQTKYIKCDNFPYQSIDSGLFYQKIINTLKKNTNIHFLKNINEISNENSFVFNSVSDVSDSKNDLWQHFSGIEIETNKDVFDDQIFNLMDFDCEQKDSVHFFYTLPFSKKNALIETTWISDLNHPSNQDYSIQLEDYIKNNLKIKNYEIKFKETGAIPLFHPQNIKKINQMEIGTAGGMTRLSTGYTFMNIQNQSKYIRENFENIQKVNNFTLNSKYKFLDNIFLKVLKKNSEKMPEIFFKMFNCSPSTVINFLSNKSNIYEDFSIILKMPKRVFLKELF